MSNIIPGVHSKQRQPDDSFGISATCHSNHSICAREANRLRDVRQKHSSEAQVTCRGVQIFYKCSTGWNLQWPDGSQLDPQIPEIGQRLQRLRLSSRTQCLREKAGCGISTWEHPRSHCIHWQAIDCVSRTASTFWSIFLLIVRTICRSFNVWIAEMGMSRRHKLSKPSTKSCWDNLEAAKWHHSDIWTCWNLLNPQFSSMISQPYPAN